MSRVSLFLFKHKSAYEMRISDWSSDVCSSDLLSMHCSANVGKNNDAAILFGLSGTGKTTLSADADRRLIGDDEIIWSDNGLCNLEDGCYAKLIDLDKNAEPVIAEALSTADRKSTRLNSSH